MAAGGGGQPRRGKVLGRGRKEGRGEKGIGGGGTGKGRAEEGRMTEVDRNT